MARRKGQPNVRTPRVYASFGVEPELRDLADIAASKRGECFSELVRRAIAELVAREVPQSQHPA